MSYATYTTEAIVCGSSDSNTADRSFLLFTKRAGMLWASARSVRLENSKQRGALQDFSVIRVSLVRGKTGWRIGSVESIQNPFLRATDRSKRAFVQLIVRSLRRFLQGEEPVPAVFEDSRRVLTLEGIDDYESAGSLYQLRLLYHLGYISSVPAVAPLLRGPIESRIGMDVPREGIRAIEQALTASHL